MALFDSLFGGRRSSRRGLAGLDPGEARSLALLDAMGGIERAGYERSASPAGAIAKNLIPLFGAMIQAKAMERQSALQSLLLQAELAKGMGDPEMRAAKIRQLEALTSQEQSLAEERRGKAASREKQQQLIDKLLAGGEGMAGAAAPSGMKPSITMGPEGATVRYSSDVLSPEALQQRKEIQAAGAGTRLESAKQLETWKQQHPKLTQRQLDALDAGNSLISILDEIPAAVESIPKDMTRGKLALNASKYQARAEYPVLSNLVTGVSGGLLSSDTDPRLDTYFSTVGQAQQALTSFGLTGLRGGYRTLQWLQVHFPGWGDDPATVQRKAAFLASNKGIVRQKVEELQNAIRNAASIAQDMGGEPIGDRVRLKARNKKTGQEQYIEYDPATGETSIPEPDATPTP